MRAEVVTSAGMTTFLLGINWKTVVGGLGQRGIEPIEQKRRWLRKEWSSRMAAWCATSPWTLHATCAPTW